MKRPRAVGPRAINLGVEECVDGRLARDAEGAQPVQTENPAAAATSGTKARCRRGLFDGDRLSEVSRLVDVIALRPRERRSEYLQRNRGKQRLEKR